MIKRNRRFSHDLRFFRPAFPLYRPFPKPNAAVKAITSADLFALPAGRHELVPDMVYAVVSQIETKPLAEAVLEAHRDYLDIQIDLEGSERIGVSSLKIPG